MDLNRIFSQNIKNLRKKYNLTQKDLANKLGYSEKAIAKWESGKALPTMDTFIAIGNIFNCSIDYLLKSHSQMYYLGIDGGGTSTKYSLADENGNIIARNIGKASNPNDYGYQATIDELKDGINKICQNISYDSIVLYAGISGLKTSFYKSEIVKEINSYNFKKTYFESDVDNALEAGLSNEDGVVAIIGTGISVIQRKNKIIKNIGGWGYLIDNGGSGYNIGLDALKGYFSNVDGLYEDSALFKKIEEISSFKKRELCSELYKNGKTYIASFAKLVIEMAEINDDVSLKIIDKNVEEAAKLILAAAKDFDGNVKIRVTGNIAESNIYFDLLKDALALKGYKNISLIECSLSDGAACLAKKCYNKN